MDAMIRIAKETGDAPEGLRMVETIHYQPDNLTQGQRQRFDRRMDLPHPTEFPMYQTKLFANPTSLGVAWYARKEPGEEEQPEPWFQVMNVDLE